MGEWSIGPVRDDDRALLDEARALFTEYHEWLGNVVCSSRLAEEIADLPGPYRAPTGRLLLATGPSGAALGCIGVRPHSGAACEVKRLYVRLEERGAGLGSALVDAAIATGRELGYAEVLVTTLPDSMPVAAAMYERLGFEQVEPFLDFSHVHDGVEMLYLRLTL